NECDRNALSPDKRGARDEERDRREQGRQSEPDEITSDRFARFIRVGTLIPWRGVRMWEVAIEFGVVHRPTPIKYTMVNIPTQIMSRVCQNRLKQSTRRRTSARYPLANTCAIIVRSHSRPTLTCRPWRPTSAKKDERNALRVGPAPIAIMLLNSLISMKRNAAPSRQVAVIAP